MMPNWYLEIRQRRVLGLKVWYAAGKLTCAGNGTQYLTTKAVSKVFLFWLVVSYCLFKLDLSKSKKLYVHG